MSPLKFMLVCFCLILGVACKNGAVRSVCVEKESQPYQSCYNQNSNVCENWETQCNVDAFGQETCNTRCVQYQQVERCETRYREVCVAYENRYYCKATKEWMTEEDFNSTCPAPAQKLSMLNSLAPKLACVENNEHNKKMVKKAMDMTGFTSDEIVKIVDTHSVDESQMATLKTILKTNDSLSVFSSIQQLAESNLELGTCSK